MRRVEDINYDMISNAIPRVLDDDEQSWEVAFLEEKKKEDYIRLLWHSNVPGSNAPESLMVAAVLSMKNMGYIMDEEEILISKGLEYYKDDNMIELYKVTAKLNNSINLKLKKYNLIKKKYKIYETFKSYIKDIDYEQLYTYDDKVYLEQIESSWLCQIIGGALGTAIEGYDYINIKKKFGDINGYVRKPNTYNDDITYEICLIQAVIEKKGEINSEDIALQWIGRIPSGWSAEDVALKNLNRGIFPPESGYLYNPYREWIGAQMRGVICGMLFPAKPLKAAELAWNDGCISHFNNGILGEIFNAVLASLSFSYSNCRNLLYETIKYIPKQSEIYKVIEYVIHGCEESETYIDAWLSVKDLFRNYNWIHAYPNLAIEIIALFYCEEDFDKCMNIISMLGQDVDCNAAQIGSIIGIMTYSNRINDKWIQNDIDKIINTYIRGFEKMNMKDLIDMTNEAKLILGK